MPKNSLLEDAIAITCIATAAIFGLISNSISLYITFTKPRFRNAFGILCSTFLICNLQAVLTLSLWCLIVLGVKSPVLSTPELLITRMIGIFVNGAYYGSLFAHFFVSLNRFCAFVYATRYNQLWTKSKALVSGIMSWAFGTFISMGHLYSDCSLTFHKNSSYLFSYSRSLAGKICSNTDASITVITVTLIACIDFTTLIKIIAYRKRMRANIATASGGITREQSIIFFRQSCILGLIYVIYTILLIIHPFVFTNKWMLFITTTLAWILVESVDGLTFLIFNCSLICKINSGAVTAAPAANLNWMQTTRLD